MSTTLALACPHLHTTSLLMKLRILTLPTQMYACLNGEPGIFQHTALLGQYQSISSPLLHTVWAICCLKTVLLWCAFCISSHTVYTQSDGGDPETTESSPPPPPLPPALVLPGELGDGAVQDGEESPPPPLPPASTLSHHRVRTHACIVHSISFSQF